VIADLNGDGKPDLAVANQGSNTVSVLLNTTPAGGPMTFAATTDVSVPDTPSGLTSGDVNGDGVPDLIVAIGTTASAPIGLVALQNTTTAGAPTASFVTATTIPDGVWPWAVALGNLGGAGRLDIAVTNFSSQTIAVFRNELAPALADSCLTNNGGCDPNATCTPTGPRTNSCACNTGYFGNGAVCAPTNSCLTNNGGCDPVTTCTPTGTATNTCGACPAGYTGDGTTGCVDINECATNHGGCDLLTTCTNTPGSFSCGPCPIGFTGSAQTGCVAVNPCLTNNGGCSPLVVCTYEGNGLRICGPCPRGFTGNGTVCTAINACNTVPNGGCDPLVVCVPTSGSRVCGPCPSGYTGSGTTQCTPNNLCATNNGGCDPLTTCTEAGRPLKVACGACPANYTGTGATGCVAGPCATQCAPNVACTIAPNGSPVCGANLARETTLSPLVPGAGWGPQGMAIGDLNGDGRPDIVVVNNQATGTSSVSVFINQIANASSPLTFAAPAVFATGVQSAAVAIADVDGDGRPDLVVTNSGSTGSATLSVLLNTTTSPSSPVTFAPAISIDNAGVAGPAAIAIADLNGDGKPDIVISGVSSNTIGVYVNTTGGIGAPSFSASALRLPNGATQPWGVALVDVNGDGAIDIVATANASAGPGEIVVWRNVVTNGIPGFIAAGVFATDGIRPFAVVAADFNGDGRPDLAVTNEDSWSVSVLLNTTSAGGAIGFAPAMTFAVSDVPHGLAAGDLDGDGVPDLVVAVGQSANAPVGLVELWNQTASNATMPSFVTAATLADGVAPWAVALGNLTGGGQLDIVVTNFTSQTVALFRNETADNSCAVNNGGCDPRATCTSTGPGTNSCACPAGYSGNGQTCAAITSCTTNNGGCDPNATCTQEPGFRICACNTGFTGDGLTCASQSADRGPGVPMPFDDSPIQSRGLVAVIPEQPWTRLRVRRSRRAKI
jgi:FG-GAP-like repeat/EGF domain/Calcium-binding EGF domain